MFFLYLYLPLLFFKNKQITKKVSFLIEEDNPSTSGVRLYENNKQLPRLSCSFLVKDNLLGVVVCCTLLEKTYQPHPPFAILLLTIVIQLRIAELTLSNNNSLT